MKLIKLRQTIITNLSISALLLLALAAVIFYNSHRNKISQDQAAQVQSETANIRFKSSELQTKIVEAKKYQEAWKILTANQKIVNNIKMDDVNAKLTSIASKYSIIKPAIRVILPEDLHDGIFNRSSVTVAVSSTSLTFEAVNDAKAISFLSEFFNSLQGYPVIINLDIKKSRLYSNQDLVQISIGKGSGAILVKVDFFWYIYKPKLTIDEAPKEAPKTTDLILSQ